jgi:hypothetical protein
MYGPEAEPIYGPQAQVEMTAFFGYDSLPGDLPSSLHVFVVPTEVRETYREVRNNTLSGILHILHLTKWKPVHHFVATGESGNRVLLGNATLTITAGGRVNTDDSCAPSPDKLSLITCRASPLVILKRNREASTFDCGLLDDRGWTFQEHYLSPRILCSGGHGIACVASRPRFGCYSLVCIGSAMQRKLKARLGRFQVASKAASGSKVHINVLSFR